MREARCARKRKYLSRQGWRATVLPLAGIVHSGWPVRSVVAGRTEAESFQPGEDDRPAYYESRVRRIECRLVETRRAGSYLCSSPSSLAISSSTCCWECRRCCCCCCWNESSDPKLRLLRASNDEAPSSPPSASSSLPTKEPLPLPESAGDRDLPLPLWSSSTPRDEFDSAAFFSFRRRRLTDSVFGSSLPSASRGLPPLSMS